MQIGEWYLCPKCGDQFKYPNCLRAHLRFRCKYRRQQSNTHDVAKSRKNVTSGDVTRPHHVTKRKAEAEDDDVIAMKRHSAADILPGVGQGLPMFDVAGAAGGLASSGAPRVPCRSAFHRVDKMLPGPTTPPSPSQAISSSSPSDVAGIATPLPLSVVTSALDASSVARHVVTGTSGLLMFPAAAMQADRMQNPMLLRAGFVAANSPNPDTFFPKTRDESAYARKFVMNNNNSVTRSDAKLVDKSSLGVAVDHSLQCRLPPPQPPPLSLHNGHRTANPMVEKLLQLVSSSPRPADSPAKSANGVGSTLSASFPSMQLVQNWCAKCNTSFRMTSDLVYHMRTQHKRDLDPTSQGRRKEDNKLRCDVCGETFKERHHLTRHMTSHT